MFRLKKTPWLLSAQEGFSCQYPTTGGLGCVEVKPFDLKTLESTEFVNDTIIDYYSKVIQDKYKKLHEEGTTKPKLHFFNAFFFKKLTERGKHTKDAVCVIVTFVCATICLYSPCI